eukprot:15350181-Ditylum_brightwellii.AAC.3
MGYMLCATSCTDILSLLERECWSCLIQCIRKVNLDIYWARARSTVRANLAGVQKVVRLSTELSISPPYPPRGLWSIGDNMGFSIVLQIIQASLEPGHYSSSSQTFDMVRHLQTAFDNVNMGSTEAQYQGLHHTGDRGSSYHATPHPIHSHLFELFIQGVQRCMG